MIELSKDEVAALIKENDDFLERVYEKVFKKYISLKEFKLIPYFQTRANTHERFLEIDLVHRGTFRLKNILRAYNRIIERDMELCLSTEEIKYYLISFRGSQRKKAYFYVCCNFPNLDTSKFHSLVKF